MSLPTGIQLYPANQRPSSLQFGLANITAVTRSPFTGSTQTVRNPGAAWETTVSYVDLQEEDRAILDAFYTSLAGMSGRFWFGDISKLTAKGNASGDYTVTSITNRNTISLSGSGTVKAGDMVSLYYRYDNTNFTQSLHQVVADSNFFNIQIRPNIRILPQAGQVAKAYFGIDDTNPIDRQHAVSVFRLAQDKVTWQIRPPNLASATVRMVEAFV